MIIDTEKNKQRDFANLLRGLVGRLRNVTAHEAHIYWPISKEDAEDLLSIVSLACLLYTSDAADE